MSLNPYRANPGDNIAHLALKALIFPGACLTHMHQANKQFNFPLRQQIKNYAVGVGVLGAQTFIYSSLAYNIHELIQKF